MTGGAGRLGVEVRGVRCDDYPATASLSHKISGVAFAVRPVSAVARLCSGHAPVVVHRNQFGGEIADGLHRVRAVRALVKSGQQLYVLAFHILAAVEDLT